MNEKFCCWVSFWHGSIFSPRPDFFTPANQYFRNNALIWFWGDFALQSLSCSRPRPSPIAPSGGSWIFMSFWVTPLSTWCRSTSRWVCAPKSPIWSTQHPVWGTQIPLGATQGTRIPFGGILLLRGCAQIWSSPKYHLGSPRTRGGIQIPLRGNQIPPRDAQIHL